MSSVFLTEFDNLVITDNAIPPFGKFDATTTFQTVTIGGSVNRHARRTPFLG
jgi:hypothetical protein